VLRHSGIRIEEMLELTHLSIRQFRKPDGQVLPLLQVAPSKSDQERILPCSPELTAVLARLIVRLTNGGSTVPLAIRRNERSIPTRRRCRCCSSYVTAPDPGESAWARSVCGWSTSPMTCSCATSTASFCATPRTISVACSSPTWSMTAFPSTWRPGSSHTSIETTRGYTAVYQKDVFEAYDKFITARRTLRPSQEYREPSQAEWAEFNDHFMRRKISLGDCRRPYGSGCTHEHACTRCQLLQVDPAQADQLDTIEDNLHARVDEARANSWFGDVDQLLLSLENLEHKKADVQAMLAALPVPLVTAVEVDPT